MYLFLGRGYHFHRNNNIDEYVSKARVWELHFKKQSPVRVYCILCPFFKDRDILAFIVALIGRCENFTA